ncbi:MAG: zinc ABC transporter substrate-binding protein [Caldilineaceae bacterium]|nr:zinc ABC transporter substrate-binding protein [Caldilineaceae bacterium]
MDCNTVKPGQQNNGLGGATGPFWKSLQQFLPLVLGAVLVGVTACSSSPMPTNDSNALPVVATFSILDDLVQNVGGEQVQVITLVGPDGDAHTFEPTPADSAALTKAAVIFENGLGLEPWLDDLYSASGATAQRVVVSNGVDLLGIHEAGAEQAATDADHADHGEFDPHIWHNVANAMQMVENIRNALSAADPDHADLYATNAENYLAELNDLDGWVRERVATLPAARRKLVTSHDTFGYFAAAYGFEIIGTAMGSASTEAADPSARDLAALAETIKAAGVPAIFAENVANPQLVEQIAQETDVKMGPPLYTDALGKAGSDGDSYIKMMRYNVDAIVNALSE